MDSSTVTSSQKALCAFHIHPGTSTMTLPHLIHLHILRRVASHPQLSQEKRKALEMFISLDQVRPLPLYSDLSLRHCLFPEGTPGAAVSCTFTTYCSPPGNVSKHPVLKINQHSFQETIIIFIQEAKKQRDKRRDCPSAGSFYNSLQQQDWTRQKSEAKTSIQVSHVE